MTAANTSTVTTMTGTNRSTEIACSTTTDDIPAGISRVRRQLAAPGNAANREDAPAMVISAGARARRRVQDRRVRRRGG